MRVHRNQVSELNSNVSMKSSLTQRIPHLTPAEVKRFQGIIYVYYHQHNRHLPWRETHNPYHILVSEIMLQQTQAERVVQKYREFLQSFPTVLTLAEAPLHKILAAWQGLGYNRRALALKKTAEILTNRFGGKVPSQIQPLMELPGIGSATASAIVTFAYLYFGGHLIYWIARA